MKSNLGQVAAGNRRDELTTTLFRMFIPVGNATAQYIWVIDKKADGSVERKKSFGVRYVPLTDEPDH